MSKVVKIDLNIISDISEFVRMAGCCSNKLYLKSDRYTVDAKSIMGIYSLDLSEPVELIGASDEFVDSLLNSKLKVDVLN